jgi:rhodanese-related sulfurtransferase
LSLIGLENCATETIRPDLRVFLASNQEVMVFEVRQPLDLSTDPEIIVGAKRIPPKDLLDNPTLIPKEKDSVVYCTCPNDKPAVLFRGEL